MEDLNKPLIIIIFYTLGCIVLKG